MEYPNFNIRVYGILMDQNDRVLISDERKQKVMFTKFPGGGLEYGEGIIDALKREYIEECNLPIEVVRHVYTTDFFEKSSFDESQVVSIYYLVKNLKDLDLDFKSDRFDFTSTEKSIEENQSFRLVPINELKEEDFTFKTDQIAWSTFLKQN